MEGESKTFEKGFADEVVYRRRKLENLKVCGLDPYFNTH